MFGFFKKKKKVKKLVTKVEWVLTEKTANVKKGLLTVTMTSGKTLSGLVTGRVQDAEPYNDNIKFGPYINSLGEIILYRDILDQLFTEQTGLNPELAESWKLDMDSLVDHEVKYKDYNRIEKTVEVEEEA